MIDGLSQVGASAVFGVVQGATEFLPISSSGHLLLLHSIIEAENVNALTFDVALHAGTLLALIWYFWADLLRLIRAGWSWLVRRPSAPSTDQRLVWYLILSAIPGALLGAAFDSWFESTVRSPLVVAITLMVAGVLLWVVDRNVRRSEGLDRLSWGKALWMGLAQAVALIPGVSRSGASMTMGRLLGLDRPSAARFSFLMAIPITAGAVIKKGFETASEHISNAQMIDMLVGVMASLIVGYLAIRFLLRFISRHSYSVFAAYRLALGVIVLLVLAAIR